MLVAEVQDERLRFVKVLNVQAVHLQIGWGKNHYVSDLGLGVPAAIKKLKQLVQVDKENTDVLSIIQFSGLLENEKIKLKTLFLAGLFLKFTGKLQ